MLELASSLACRTAHRPGRQWGSGEAGTGTGPTLEFFTLVSREVQRKDLAMWYQSETAKQQPVRTQESELVYNPPAEDVRMHDVHRVAVLHCDKCNHTAFPVSPHTGSNGF